MAASQQAKWLHEKRHGISHHGRRIFAPPPPPPRLLSCEHVVYSRTASPSGTRPSRIQSLAITLTKLCIRSFRGVLEHPKHPPWIRHCCCIIFQDFKNKTHWIDSHWLFHQFMVEVEVQNGFPSARLSFLTAICTEDKLLTQQILH